MDDSFQMSDGATDDYVLQSGDASYLLSKKYDPGVWLEKAPAKVGKVRKRFFVLHRRDRQFAYYTMAFIPPAKAHRKGTIKLESITGISNKGNVIEISVARGRPMFRLSAEDETIASDWAYILKIETQQIRSLTQGAGYSSSSKTRCDIDVEESHFDEHILKLAEIAKYEYLVAVGCLYKQLDRMKQKYRDAKVIANADDASTWIENACNRRHADKLGEKVIECETAITQITDRYVSASFDVVALPSSMSCADPPGDDFGYLNWILMQVGNAVINNTLRSSSASASAWNMRKGGNNNARGGIGLGFQSMPSSWSSRYVDMNTHEDDDHQHQRQRPSSSFSSWRSRTNLNGDGRGRDTANETLTSTSTSTQFNLSTEPHSITDHIHPIHVHSHADDDCEEEDEEVTKLMQLHSAKEKTLRALLTPRVTLLQNRYDNAQMVAISDGSGKNAMASILTQKKDVRSDKVTQTWLDDRSNDVSVVTQFEELIEAAKSASPDIHATLTSTFRRIGLVYEQRIDQEPQRILAKVYQEYDGEVKCATNVVRGTVTCDSYTDMANALEALKGDERIEVLRGLFSVDPNHDASASGGYRDVRVEARLWGDEHVFEVQLVLQSMYIVKNSVDSSFYHTAKAVGAYDTTNYGHVGSLTAAVISKIESGHLLQVKITDKGGVATTLLDGLWDALSSPSCRVRSLNMMDVEIGNHGAQGFGRALRVNVSLVDVNLTNNRFSEEGGTSIGTSLTFNKTLQSLNLYKNNLGEMAGIAIGNALMNNTTLKALNLNWNNLGEQGGIAMGSALQVNTTLQTLDLYKNNLGVNGGIAIGEGLARNTGLKSLDLWGNNFSDQAGIAIAMALSMNTTLRTLDLYKNNLGHEGCIALAKALITNVTLQTLNLVDNNLGEKGGVALAKSLTQNNSLLTLSLKFNNFSRDVNDTLDSAWGSRGGKLSL